MSLLASAAFHIFTLGRGGRGVEEDSLTAGGMARAALFCVFLLVVVGFWRGVDAQHTGMEEAAERTCDVGGSCEDSSAEWHRLCASAFDARYVDFGAYLRSWYPRMNTPHNIRRCVDE